MNNKWFLSDTPKNTGPSHDKSFTIVSRGSGTFDIREKYRSAIQNVSEQTEETAYLIIKSGNDALCLDRIVGSFPIQVLTFEVGERRPLGIGGGSLAILSSYPDDVVHRIIKANAEKYPNFMGRTGEDVLKMVAKTRRDGYALSKKKRQ